LAIVRAAKAATMKVAENFMVMVFKSGLYEGVCWWSGLLMSKRLLLRVRVWERRGSGSGEVGVYIPVGVGREG
jgi:hypothetical protein